MLKDLEAFTHLNIIDSSSVSLHSSLSQLFKGSGGVASDAALKIQLMFAFIQGQVKELTLTSGISRGQAVLFASKIIFSKKQGLTPLSLSPLSSSG